MSGDGQRPAVHFMEGDAQHHRQPNAVLRATSQNDDTLSNILRRETSQSGDTLSNINSRQPSRSKFHTPSTKPTRATGWMTWMIGACCALMWTIVILGGLAVLIIYLVFRPKSPRLDIQSATLNGAYLDTGTLLNADITILANFSNPNRKVDVAFSYVQMDLYFMETMIATQAVEPFAERRGDSALKSLHMVVSEVALRPEAAKEWQRGTAAEGVALEVAGRFRTRSDFGKWVHFTYWLYGRCSIVIGAPPSGALLSSRCRTKR